MKLFIQFFFVCISGLIGGVATVAYHLTSDPKMLHTAIVMGIIYILNAYLIVSSMRPKQNIEGKIE